MCLPVLFPHSGRPGMTHDAAFRHSMAPDLVDVRAGRLSWSDTMWCRRGPQLGCLTLPLALCETSRVLHGRGSRDEYPVRSY